MTPGDLWSASCRAASMSRGCAECASDLGAALQAGEIAWGSVGRGGRVGILDCPLHYWWYVSGVTPFVPLISVAERELYA